MSGKSTIKHKVCRALGVNLIGSPSAALTLSRRPNRPGQHGASRQAKISPFGQQLKETQKLKAFYGIGSKQLRRYYEKAARVRKQTNVALVQTLETRLDNMTYRMGFAGTLRAARQMVVHCHITVNGKVLNIPSYSVSINDTIAVREKSKSLEVISSSLSNTSERCEYVQWNPDIMSGKLAAIPQREQISENIKEQLIVELYSK